MKKKRGIFFIGGLIVACGFFLSLKNALNDYGIGDNLQHLQVLAQTSSNGESGSATGGPLWNRIADSCTIRLRGNADGIVRFWGQEYRIPFGATIELTFEKIEIVCEEGGYAKCSSYDCYQFWKDGGGEGSYT